MYDLIGKINLKSMPQYNMLEYLIVE